MSSRILKTAFVVLLCAMCPGSPLPEPQDAPTVQSFQDLVDQLHALQNAVAQLDARRTLLEREIAAIRANQPVAPPVGDKAGLAVEEANIVSPIQQRPQAVVGNRPAP